jgi:DNA excision repair protein ERCC-4
VQVGDFVLTPDICVERKAIPDLISSLDSGRLYTQATAMSKHYSQPVLLIEFDPEKAFALQSMADIGSDIRAGNVASKLVLLLLNFPKLRRACAHLLLNLQASLWPAVMRRVRVRGLRRSNLRVDL